MSVIGQKRILVDPAPLSQFSQAMIRHTLASIPLFLSLTFATSANAQLGFVAPDLVTFMAVGMALRKTDCRARFPELAADIDRAWEAMIERNTVSIPREMWKAVGEVSMPLRNQQSREDCAQMATSLDAADFRPTVAAIRSQTDCMTRLRAATERRKGPRPVIGIVLSEAGTEALVAEADSNGPAANAGVLVGDVITEWGTTATPTKCDLAVAVLSSDTDKQVSVVVNRRGTRLNLSVVPSTASEED